MSVHASAARGFERQAEAYERGRPSYPPEAAEWLIRRLGLTPGAVAVDVGAGTGKLTRVLLSSGADVTAVEPVAGMRAVLERELPAVRAVDGSAESMPLDDGLAAAIVVGQAFHWFDTAATLAEFHRVLRPGGRLGIIWNVRDRRQQLQRAIDELTEPLRGDTPSQAAGAWRERLTESPLFRKVEEFHHSYQLELDAATFVDRIGSVSFIAALDEPQRSALLDRARGLAEQHPEPWAYVTEAYVYERQPGT